MEIKEAVKLAKRHVADLFGDEGIEEIGLEEIELGRDGFWKITIGFSRHWQRAPSSIIGGKSQRTYKVVRVRDTNCQVMSVRDRLLADSQ